MKTGVGTAIVAFRRLTAVLGGLVCACPVFAADVTIAWDANTEPDVSGYNIYFRKGSSGPPYTMFGHVDLQQIDPANPTTVVTGLENDAVYYLSVTALDTEGYESIYSSPACAQIVGGIAQPCADEGISGGSEGSGGGGSGGGGCFVKSLMSWSRTASDSNP